MAEPISRSVSTMPSQDDPANFQWWADYHSAEADKIAAADPPENEMGRVGQLQGEMDHRASAAMFLARIERQKDPEYAVKAKAELELRGILNASAPTRSARAEIIMDTQNAFRDYGIPERLAEYAVTAAQLDKMPDAADRERFYNNILDAKRDLDVIARDNGEDREISGVNDWESVIDAAAVRFDKREEQLAASNHWRLNNEAARARFPLLSDSSEIEKVTKAGTWRAALIARIPVDWQRRLGLDPERIYNNAMEKAYARVIDQKRDALLSERSNALATLRGADMNVPLHLLPSKQYRAAEQLTQIDRELRRLSPLDKAEYGVAVNAAATPEKAVQVAAERAPARAQIQTAEKAPAIQTGPSKHELALQDVRELRAQTPVDGYRSRAAEAMANRIVQQLQEGRDTISLSTKYAGGDQGQAASTHANAIEANKQLIDAVRDHGIPVDTGKASLAVGKKAEVELSAQAQLDQSV